MFTYITFYSVVIAFWMRFINLKDMKVGRGWTDLVDKTISIIS